MTVKRTDQLADVLEFCLANLEAGMTIEEILKKVPEYEAVIRPMLETAHIARSDSDYEVPAAVLHRSRTRLLVRAEQLRAAQAAGRTRRIPWLRLALQVLGVLVVVSASLTSLFAASAKTVPGDGLYRFKRFGEEARLTLSSPIGRDRLLNAYRERRIGEIEELLRLRRSVPVMFEGVVTDQGSEQWTVGGLDVTITPQTVITGNILRGMFVEVQGLTTEDGRLRAINIYLRAYAFIGTLEEVNGQTWVVNGIPVRITSESQLAPNIALGSYVVVLARVDNNGTLFARAVLFADGTGKSLELDDSGNLMIETGSPVPAITATPSPTPSPSSTPPSTGDSDDVFEPTETEDDNSGSGSGADPDETDSPDETDEPDETKTPEPTETEEESSNSGSSATNTPEPTRTPKPTGTPEPTKTPDDD